MAEKQKNVKKLAAQLFMLTEEENKEKEKKEQLLFKNTYDNFENILERKGPGLKKEIETRMNGRKTRKYGKDVMRRTESLRKDIEAKKKSEIIKEMKSYSEAVGVKAKLWKFAGTLKRHILLNGISYIKEHIAEMHAKNAAIKVAILPPVTIPKLLPAHHKHPSIRLCPKKNIKCSPSHGIYKRKQRAATIIQRCWKQYAFRKFLQQHVFQQTPTYANESFVELDLDLTNQKSQGSHCYIV